MNCEAVQWALAQSAPTLSSSAKFLLVAIASRIEGGCLTASQSELAEIVNLGDRQVRTLLKQLETLGLISRKRRGGAGAGRLADAISLMQTQPEKITTSEQAENIAVATGKIRRSNRKELPQQPENIAATQPEILAAIPVDNYAPGIKHAPTRVEDNLLTSKKLELYSERVELAVTAPAKVLNGSARGLPAQQLAEVLADHANNPFLDPSKYDGLRTTCGRIHRWMTAGADFDADILPTVVRLAAKANKPVRSWGYFEDAVREATATRLASEAPMEIITPQEALNDQRNRPSSTYSPQRRRARSVETEILMRDILDGTPERER